MPNKADVRLKVDVSILILMEVALEDGYDGFKYSRILVSILILMEVALEVVCLDNKA